MTTVSESSLTLIHSTHASLNGFEANGLLKRHLKLVSEYAKRYEVTVYTSDKNNYSDVLGVKHVNLPSSFTHDGWSHLQYFHWLRMRAKDMNGIVKVFGSNIPTLGQVRSASGRPLVVTFQWDYQCGIRKDSSSYLRRAIAPWLEKRSLAPADLVLVTTKRLQEIVQSRYKKPTAIIPNWVDFAEICDQTSILPKQPNLIVYAGRLSRIKGLSCLVSAFERASRSFPEAQLEIFGSGEEESRLKQITIDRGLTQVTFRGVCENSVVLQRMRQASIFVLPTLTMEGQPKALLEAMACGTACIGSNVPGISDIINHYDNGILFPSGDSDALAAALELLLRSDELRKSLLEKALLLVKDFTLSRIVGVEASLFDVLSKV